MTKTAKASRLVALIRDYAGLPGTEFRERYPEYPADKLRAAKDPSEAMLDFLIDQARKIAPTPSQHPEPSNGMEL